MEMAINIACQGVWKKWDKNINIGSKMQFKPDDLFLTNDENVTSLMNLWQNIVDTIETVENSKIV